VSRWFANIRRPPRRVVYVPTLPHVVEEYLMPSERIVTAVRMHPIAIIRPAILILAGLIGVGFVTGTAGSGGAFTTIVWILWFALLAWQGWKIATWWRRYFVVTENRLMLITSLIDTDVGMMPLAKVTDMRLHQSTAGRMFGYGEFIVESAGQDQALSKVPFVPYPKEMYQEILALIFPAKTPPAEPPESREPPTSQGPQRPQKPQGPAQRPPGPTRTTWPNEPSPPDVPSERPGDDPGF
jgi:uncharacterized membrane protein YdbT with pleckstrin-like domain